MPYCLGIQTLGQCAYDPANPANLYFSIGEAVAAMSVTLLIPQFLKPIYVFRLRAQSIRLVHIYSAVFVAGALVVIASAIPQSGYAGVRVLGFPIVWEFIAGILFICSFGALAWPAVSPAHVRKGRVEEFANAVADFLAHTDDTQRGDIAPDLVKSAARLSASAQFVEFRGETSAFFDFTHRRQIKDGVYAAHLFRLLADPIFCATLVSRRSWDTSRILYWMSRSPSDERSSCAAFVRELGRQAIIHPASMMGRETGYTGFARVPVVTQALFRDRDIAWYYHPLRGLQFDDFEDVNEDICRRFFRAVRGQLSIVLGRDDYWGDRSLISLGEEVRWLTYYCDKQVRTDRRNYGAVSELGHGMERAVKQTRERLASAPQHIVDQLFLTTDDHPHHRHHTTLDEITDAVANMLGAFANRFEGADDPFWIAAINIFDAVFDRRYGTQQIGIDPLQQRVALKLLETIEGNMQGLFPLLPRVLLPVIGPYGEGPPVDPRSALGLFTNAFYRAFLRFPEFQRTNPEHAQRMLSPDMRFDAASSSLVRVYRGGEERATDLRSLHIPEISFFDVAHRSRPPS